MKYMIMMTLVIGLAAADFLTGIMKAYLQHDLSSAKMRAGGLNKLCEIIVALTACGVEIGIKMLGAYYQTAALAAISGTVAAGLVFAYIVTMELISILENYGEMTPDAVWVRGIVRKLRSFERKDDEYVHSETDKTRSGE